MRTCSARPSGAASVAGVVGGSFQIAKSSVTSLCTAHARGLPLIWIAPGGEYDGSLPPVIGLIVRADGSDQNRCRPQRQDRRRIGAQRLLLARIARVDGRARRRFSDDQAHRDSNEPSECRGRNRPHRRCDRRTAVFSNRRSWIQKFASSAIHRAHSARTSCNRRGSRRPISPPRTPTWSIASFA